MADGDDPDYPILHRPIPRRPFAHSLTSPTPPDDDDDDDVGTNDNDNDNNNEINNHSNKDASSDDPQSKEQLVAKFRRELRSAGLFGIEPSLTPVSSSLLIRGQSFHNLSSSTLAGIYSPTVHEDNAGGMHSPWGTGAESPVKRYPETDEATYQIMRQRSFPPARRPLYSVSGTTTARARTRARRRPVLTLANAHALLARAALLFGLGMGYGYLLTRFQNEQGQEKNTRNYLFVCGVGGMTLGGLQPWFDTFWEDTFASELEERGPPISSSLPGKEKVGPSTDWALIMRAIGAFVGIAYAIRKLAWTSTMQVSTTLALVNPLLWWLIDRSTPGFILSAGFALVGSVVLFGIDSDMMPSPPSASLIREGNASTGAGADWSLMLGGLASQETIESAIWMLSVLFCSSLCFGNIGRRLAWGDAAVTRGRWGGMR